MTQEPERLPHGFRERLEELFSNLRQGVLYLRRLVLPSSGLMIGEARLSGADDGDGNIDPYWRRPDGTESNLSIGGSAGGAPADAQYVTLALDGDLSAERVLTAGEGIDLTDGGANSTITVTVDLSEISAGGDLGGTMEAPTVDDGADSTALHDNVAAEINAIAEKTTPVAADLLVVEDSAASNAKKKVQVSNLKTPLKAVLYSVHQYIFTPDAGVGEDVETGAHQGNIYVSGPSNETVKRITAIAETAAGTAFTFTLDYDNGNDDFDSFTVDTEIEEVAMGTAKGVVVTSGFTNATITAQSLMSLDVTTVTGTAPQDVTIILEVWRPLQT